VGGAVPVPTRRHGCRHCIADSPSGCGAGHIPPTSQAKRYGCCLCRRSCDNKSGSLSHFPLARCPIVNGWAQVTSMAQQNGPPELMDSRGLFSENTEVNSEFWTSLRNYFRIRGLMSPFANSPRRLGRTSPASVIISVQKPAEGTEAAGHLRAGPAHRQHQGQDAGFQIPRCFETCRHLPVPSCQYRSILARKRIKRGLTRAFGTALSNRNGPRLLPTVGVSGQSRATSDHPR
jgi:hypothetical protein